MTLSDRPSLNNAAQSFATTSDGRVVAEILPATFLLLYLPSSWHTESSSISNAPSNQPSLTLINTVIPSKTSLLFALPSTSTTFHPSATTSLPPSFAPSFTPNFHLSSAPHSMTSFSLTSSPGRPEQLLKSKTFDSASLILLKYKVVIYPNSNDLDELLCVHIPRVLPRRRRLHWRRLLGDVARSRIRMEGGRNRYAQHCATLVAINIEEEGGASTL